MSGWIKLHRSIQNNWIYKEKRTFSKFEAWIDLLLEANHKDNRLPLGNEIVECKRGQLIISIRKLCDRWNWSNTKVKNFLNLLQNDNMIDYFSDTKKTVISIENYDFYQGANDTETFQERHENDTKATRKHTNKNVKNVKNDKNVFVQIFDLYVNECHSLPPIKAITDRRKRAVNARIREHGQDAVCEMLKKAGRSCFLAGQNKSGWVANFDWLFKPNNFVKVLEGNYDNRKEQLINSEVSTSGNVVDYESASQSKYGW